MEKDKKESMWKNQRRTVKSVVVEVLESLLFAMDSVVMHNIDRHSAYHAMNKIDNRYRPAKCSKIIDNLERGGYLKRVKNKVGQESFQFTSKAKMKLIDKISANLTIGDHYHFLSFDIPEIMRTKRNKFRRLIKLMGFVQIQQSLWVINKDVGGLVEEIAHDLEVEQYVIYIISAMTDIDSLIARKLISK